MGSLESSLPDEVIISILSFGSAADLCRFQSASKRYRDLDTEGLWKTLCDAQCDKWPAYCRQTVKSASSTWKGRFQWMYEDYSRNELDREEIERLQWSFSFLPWAGGSEDGDNLSPACFVYGNLYLMNYVWLHPQLEYELVDVDSPSDLEQHIARVKGDPLRESMRMTKKSMPRISTAQYLRIGLFPPHIVARTSEGGWLMWNENVVFSSSGGSRDEEVSDDPMFTIRTLFAGSRPPW